MAGRQDAPTDSPRPRSKGRISTWLSRVPVEEPVDRRNAPMLQIVLLLLGIPTPLLWLYRILFTDMPWREGDSQSLALAMATSALALFSFWLIRRGHFQWAIRQILVLIAASTVLAYATQGAQPQVFEEPVLVVWIVLAGLMIGRGALWLMFAAVVAAFFAGGVHAVVHAPGPEWPFTELMILTTKVIIMLMIAVVVDRSVAALRETLAESSRRADALALANTQLEAEMAERKQVEEQLVHAQRVEAAGRLAAGVAHDFNHLLTLIFTYVAKGRGAPDEAGVREALEGVNGATERAASITRRMLDFSRHDSAQSECFDACEALRGVEPLLRQMLDARVVVQMSLPEHALPIRFNRTQLDLVILNVAANAGAAMPEGGYFRVSAQTGNDPGTVVIHLDDTGTGMSPEVLARVFEPFFTTRTAGEGIGLGLSVVQGVMRAHGGRIDVSSVVGKGTRFSLTLLQA